MCGINGFNFKDEGLIQKMNQAVAHRGPDDAGFFVSEGISLGHQRLSIIDLSPKGHQPMISEDGRFTIVFNGEIYNFKEIREKLADKHAFKSETDTEVILNAYREYGANCLNEFNGIFAFAIWDEEKKELFVARDRMGIKPFYYWQDGDRFVFSSEIKAIIEAGAPREIDFESLNLYFRVLYVPAPLTMFKNIFKLLPAHYGIFKWNKFSAKGGSAFGGEIKKYWEIVDFSDLPDRQAGLKNKKEAILKIKELTKDAVKRQLVSDRPVGVFLSGGIDSTAILGITREIAPEITKTYSVGFDVDVEAERYNADFELARKTAEFYKTDHHELKVSGRDVLENIEKIIWHMDEPVANATVAPMYLLSKMAKKDVAVVLGGDGGDELFGGYQRYYYSAVISKYQKLPSFLRFILEKIIKISKLNIPAGVERFLSFHAQKDEIISRVLKQEIFKKDAARNFFDKFFEEDFCARGASVSDGEKHFMDADRRSWLVDESLLRTDKMTMANGLEERAPILDYRLVELANRIPTKWKLGGKERGKKIWIEAMKEYLPKFILSEKKRGWFSPMSKWLRGDLKDFARQTLSELPEDIFNRAECQKILENHINASEYNLNIIWALIVWQIWHKQFID